MVSALPGVLHEWTAKRPSTWTSFPYRLYLLLMVAVNVRSEFVGASKMLAKNRAFVAFSSPPFFFFKNTLLGAGVIFAAYAQRRNNGDHTLEQCCDRAGRGSFARPQVYVTQHWRCKH